MAQSSELFRPEAMQSLASQGIYKDALRVMRPRLWGAGLVMAAVIVGGLVWSAFFTIPVSVSGQGILLSSGGVADVVADAGGQVHELVVAPGSMVSADMIIARIAQPDVALELTVAQGQLADAQRFQRELMRFQEQDLSTRNAARDARLHSLEQRLSAMTVARSFQAHIMSGYGAAAFCNKRGRERWEALKTWPFLTNHDLPLDRIIH